MSKALEVSVMAIAVRDERSCVSCGDSTIHALSFPNLEDLVYLCRRCQGGLGQLLVKLCVGEPEWAVKYEDLNVLPSNKEPEGD